MLVDELTLPLKIEGTQRSIDTALQQIFVSKQEETRSQKARRIVGRCVNQIADEELEVYLTEFQHLIDSWLDNFERQAYSGLTLRQLLQE